MINKLSVVIPTFNSSKTIIQTIGTIVASVNLPLEIIVVDDCSIDNTVAILSDFQKNNPNIDIKIKKLSLNQGPGIARNIGFNYVTGNYTIFFDSDDIMEKIDFSEIIQSMSHNDIDVGLFKYKIKYTIDDTIHSMCPNDEKIFSMLMRDNRTITASEYPDILRLVNYPWNKVQSTNYLKKINLNFGNLRLHEDIALHWQILIQAKRIRIFDFPLCQHVFYDQGVNLTYISGVMRLQVTDALIELKNFLHSLDNTETYLKVFFNFSLCLLEWADSIIEPIFRNVLHKRSKIIFSDLNYSDLLEYRHSKPSWYSLIQKILA